jgi:hypothetical protein
VSQPDNPALGKRSRSRQAIPLFRLCFLNDIKIKNRGSKMTVVIFLWILSIIATFWVWSDASDKRGGNIGCLWALIVLKGPLGFIAYLFVRNSD